MPRGGRRPGAGAKKGVARTQKSREDVDERRRMVRTLLYAGQKPPEIVANIRRQAAYLLDGLRACYEVILQDIAVIREEDVGNLHSSGGLYALAAYVESQSSVMRRARAASERAQGQAEVRALQLESECADKIARGYGIPTDRPAFHLDLGQLLPLRDVSEAPVQPSRGIVDPVTFATDPYFCGLNLDKFPMQRRILADFLSPTSNYRSLILICGMRSGKGIAASVIAWYAAYELLSLADPQAYFGLAPRQEIQIITMATNEAQAKNNLFKHIKDRLATGGDFFAGLRPDVRETGLELHLPKDVVIRCGHSRATGLVGATSYVVILDELPKFKDTEGRDNADAVFDLMSATTATFKDAARVLCIGSPAWAGDKGMRLLEQAMEIDEDGHFLHPTMLGIQMPTWEANLNLSQEYLWEAFNGAENPRAFWRDFGAAPPEATEAYYPDPERWDRQADPERQHPYDQVGRLAEWFRPCCDARRYVHIDLGATRDACGLAMAHKPVPGCPWYEPPRKRGIRVAEDAPPVNPNGRKIVLDVCLQVAPPREREAKPEISFEAIRQIIRDWDDRGFHIKGGQVSFDGWQSLDSQQQLRREGYHVEEFSLDRDTEGHDTLLELLNTNQLSYYKHPVLIREAKQLSLLRGKRVNHPAGGSKDVADAVAGSAYWALKKGGRISFVG
jgi:hypothetical protein